MSCTVTPDPTEQMAKHHHCGNEHDPLTQGIYDTLRNKYAHISHRRRFLLSSCVSPFISMLC